MKQLLIDTLESIYPTFKQGTLNDQEAYPDNFITYWVDYTDDGVHLDNEVRSIEWSFSVIFYSTSQALVDTVPAQIRADLKNAGFIPQGRGNDIASDRPSHKGWAMDFIGVEIL